MSNFRNINIKRMIIWIIFVMFAFSTSSTFAYWWDGTVTGTNNNGLGTITVGEWTMPPEGIDGFSMTTDYHSGDLVWFNGDFWIYKGNYSYGQIPSVAHGWTYLNDLNWYSEIIYQSTEIVFYNGIVYQTSGYTDDDNPESGAPWVSMMNNQVQWTTGDSTTTNQQVYHDGSIWVFRKYYTTSEPGTTNEWSLLGDLTFSTNYVYANGDVTYYNGTYYTTNNGGWATGTTPGNPYGPWTALTVPNWSNAIPNGTTYVNYNGGFYKALVTNMTTLRNNQPGTSSAFGVWTQLDTQLWQQYNTYSAGNLIMYNGDIFMLANASYSTLVPGTAGNSWNYMNNMGYDPFNTYSVGDFVVINSIVYEVVNATNANNHAPGTYANAWNRLSGYDWYWFNNYVVGDILYHEDGVYIALAASTNVEPGTPGSDTYWGLYNENA